MIFGLVFCLAAQAGTDLRLKKTVLNGALIRAGGPGGTKSIPDSLVNSLCEQGIKTIYYLYPSKDFPNKDE